MSCSNRSRTDKTILGKWLRISVAKGTHYALDQCRWNLWLIREPGLLLWQIRFPMNAQWNASTSVQLSCFSRACIALRQLGPRFCAGIFSWQIGRPDGKPWVISIISMHAMAIPVICVCVWRWWCREREMICLRVLSTHSLMISFFWSRPWYPSVYICIWLVLLHVHPPTIHRTCPVLTHVNHFDTPTR